MQSHAHAENQAHEIACKDEAAKYYDEYIEEMAY